LGRRSMIAGRSSAALNLGKIPFAAHSVPTLLHKNPTIHFGKSENTYDTLLNESVIFTAGVIAMEDALTENITRCEQYKIAIDQFKLWMKALLMEGVTPNGLDMIAGLREEISIDMCEKLATIIRDNARQAMNASPRLYEKIMDRLSLDGILTFTDFKGMVHLADPVKLSPELKFAKSSPSIYNAQIQKGPLGLLESARAHSGGSVPKLSNHG
jgi:hypothetical protein